MKLIRNVGRVAAILLCTTSMTAFAQSAPEKPGAAEADHSGLGEIVVTARRRSESVSKVPTAIQVVNSAALVQRGIKNESDLQTAVPGLVVRASNNQNQLNYVIRGESIEPYSGSSPGVQPYFNDVALSGNSPTAFYDVESVQVLKGPQGTLFGRNSTGGAVLYQSAAPKDTLGGYGSIQYGNLKKLDIEAAVNVPLGEKAALRLAGTYQSGGAYVHNIYDGKLLGNSKVRSGRATLKVTPIETLTNTLMVQYGKYGGTNNGNRILSTIACGAAANPSPNIPPCWAVPGNADYQRLLSAPQGTYFPGWPNGYIYPGGIRALPGYLDSLGKYYVDDNGNFDYHDSDLLVTNNTSWELNDHNTIKNVFGYSKTKRRFEYDNDANFLPSLQAGGGLPGGDQLETRHTRIISEELQLQGKALDDKLTYILGGFYSNSKTYNNSPITGLYYVAALHLFGDFMQRYKSDSHDITKAVFTQATYKVTDEFHLTGGIRQTWDKLSLTQLPGSTITGPPHFQTHNSDQSWTFSADYQVTPEAMIYVTTRGSWRVGGYNPFVKGAGDRTTSVDGGNYFPPERVRDVEAGVKYNGHLGAVPWRWNADIYKAWITNVQKTAYGVIGNSVTSATTTAPHATVKGFELDGEMKPADWLRVGGSFSLTVARYGSAPGQAFSSLVTFGPFSDAPKYQGTLFGEVSTPLPGDAGGLVFHVDGYAQSLMHISNLGNSQNPFDMIPGYVLLNARIDWNDPMGFKGLTASLFAKNITEKRYFIGGSGGIGIDGKNSATFGQPRTYGAVLKYSF
jgi:iron complex outermembrane receptor protein